MIFAIILAVIAGAFGIWVIATNKNRVDKAKQDGTYEEKRKQGEIIGFVVGIIFAFIMIIYFIVAL